MAAAGSSTHRVRATIFDLRWPDESSAFQGRSRLEQALFETVIPLLEEQFDLQQTAEQEVHLDRLEIDLGRFDPERLDVSRLRLLVREALADRMAAWRPAAAGDGAPPPSIDRTLLAFLTAGTWPWDAPVTTVEALEAAVRALPPAAARRVAGQVHALFSRARVRRRLSQQFSPDFLTWLIEMQQPERAAPLLRHVRAALPDAAPEAQWAAALGVAAALPAGERATAREVTRLLRRRPPAITPPAGPPPLRPAGAPRDRPVRLPAASRPEEEERPGQPLYVRYAGIVLLHPFLARYYQTLGLGPPGALLAERAQRERAAHLLFHLATGGEHPSEPETTLFKVLAALPIGTPLVRYLPLRDEEREESTQLLTAAIRHWARLGSSSPQALREGFLQRDGRLEATDRGWHLHVERRSLDILLDFLPWSISIVRLPWMDAPLTVDWA